MKEAEVTAAYDAAVDAMAAIAALQETEVWLSLPRDAQVAICRARGTMASLATALAE